MYQVGQYDWSYCLDLLFLTDYLSTCISCKKDGVKNILLFMGLSICHFNSVVFASYILKQLSTYTYMINISS